MERGILFDRTAVVAAVGRAGTQADALRLLGLAPQADNYRRLRDACSLFDLQVPSAGLAESIAAIDAAVLLELKDRGATAQEILRATGHPVKPVTKEALRARWVELDVEPAPERRRPPRSPLQDPEAVAKAVSDASSMAAALRGLGMAAARKNYDALEVACRKFGLEPPARRANGAGRKPAGGGVSTASAKREFAEWRTASSEARALTLIADGLLAGQILNLLAIPKSQAAYAWLRDLAAKHGVEIEKPSRFRLNADDCFGSVRPTGGRR